jgi:hypothetical protein
MGILKFRFPVLTPIYFLEPIVCPSYRSSSVLSVMETETEYRVGNRTLGDELRGETRAEPKYARVA